MEVNHQFNKKNGATPFGMMIFTRTKIMLKLGNHLKKWVVGWTFQGALAILMTFPLGFSTVKTPRVSFNSEVSAAPARLEGCRWSQETSDFDGFRMIWSEGDGLQTPTRWAQQVSI